MTNRQTIIAIQCPPRCSAGGSEQDGGHVFDRDADMRRCDECGREYFTTEPVMVASICPSCFQRTTHTCGGSLVCRCGLSAMDFSLMTGD